MPTDNPSWWRQLLSRLTSIVHRSRGANTSHDDDRNLVLSLSPSRIPSAKQLTYLPRLLTVKERRIIRLGLFIASLSLLGLVGRLLFRHVIFVPTKGGTLTEAVVGMPQYLNPVLARPYSADTKLTQLLFRGLAKVDGKMNIVPDLASTIAVSPDGKVFTATLRPNLKWSDGTALTSADVVYTYETIANVSYQSPIQGLYKNVTVTAPDEHTVVFTLAAPYYPLQSALTLGILPAAPWQDQTPQTFALAELNVKPIGSGPYKFQSVTKDRNGNIRGYTFSRNTYYIGTPPLIDKISIKIYPEISSALDALTSNAVDSLGGISVNDLSRVSKSRKVSRYNLSQLTAVFFSQKTNPVIKAKEVRQALAMTVDRSALIKTSFGGIGLPANGPLLPGQPGYAADVKSFGLDIAQANAILDKAGWVRGDNGLRTKAKQGLAFTLTTVDEPSYSSAANALASAWKAIGVNVTVNIVDQSRIQKDVIKPRNYDALLFGQISNADANPYPFWHSSQQRDPGLALAVSYIKKVDQTLEAAQSATTADAFTSAIHDFQAVIADEVPAIVLNQSQYLYAHQHSLRGFSNDALTVPADRFDSIANLYLKTRWSWK